MWPGGLTLPTGPPLTFDAVLREQHPVAYAATTVPIEGGAQVTDHVQPLPLTPVMDVGLTDTPDQFVRPQFDRAKSLYGQLVALSATRQPMDVVTSLRIYTSMVILSISTPRTAESGRALICTVTWQQIEIATVDQSAVLADALLASALGPQSLGNLQPATDTAVTGTTPPVVV